MNHWARFTILGFAVFCLQGYQAEGVLANEKSDHEIFLDVDLCHLKRETVVVRPRLVPSTNVERATLQTIGLNPNDVGSFSKEFNKLSELSIRIAEAQETWEITRKEIELPANEQEQDLSGGSGIDSGRTAAIKDIRRIIQLKAQTANKIKVLVNSFQLNETKFRILVDYHLRKKELALTGARMTDRLKDGKPLFKLGNGVEEVVTLAYPPGHITVYWEPNSSSSSGVPNSRARVFLNAGFYNPDFLNEGVTRSDSYSESGQMGPAQIVEVLESEDDPPTNSLTGMLAYAPGAIANRRLKAFPAPRYQKEFQTTHSVRVDPKGWLWVLDYGHLRYFGGKPKVMAFDINAKDEADQLKFRYEFPIEIAPLGSFLNDMIVVRDEDGGGTLIIDDTSAMAKSPALIVLRFDRTGKEVEAHRLLEGHYSLTAQPTYNHYYLDYSDKDRSGNPKEKIWKSGIHWDSLIYNILSKMGLESTASNWDTAMKDRSQKMNESDDFLTLRIGVDGIALDRREPKRENWVLYYGAANRGELYRINFADLMEVFIFKSKDERANYSRELHNRVERFAEITNTDGITFDSLGNIYITNQSGPGGIVRIDSKGELTQVVTGAPGEHEVFAWPVSTGFGPDGYLYFTTYSLPLVTNRVPSIIKKYGPYHVFRVNLNRKGLQNGITERLVEGTIGH